MWCGYGVVMVWLWCGYGVVMVCALKSHTCAYTAHSVHMIQSHITHS